MGESKPDEEKLPVRGHIMVVDDEASIVRFMTVLLEQLGCRVTGLTSASEALAVFKADPYAVDLVLTDQTMPELSGVELARAILACRADIPIVLSTGYSNAIDDDTARQIGIRRFLIKPVPAKVLADIVAEYLSVPVPGVDAG
jgi:CheY-like chemotaxis protein